MQNKNVRLWQLEDEARISVGDFNNVTDEKLAVFPGKHGDSAYEVKPEEAVELKTLKLNEADYKYSFKGNGYFYGITNEDTEIIAILKGDELTPITAGVGGYKSTLRGETYVGCCGVADFSAETVDGVETLTVCYKTECQKGYVKVAKNTYTFNYGTISAVCDFECIDLPSDAPHFGFERPHLNEASLAKIRVAYNWVYPEDNDCAYREVDAYVHSEVFGDTAVYSFFRDKNSSNQFDIKAIKRPPNGFGLANTRNQTEFIYSVKINTVFVPVKESESYEALFMGREMDFAAGIASVEKNENNTMFVGKDVTLNLNVTNISADTLRYSARYNIMDYYNNQVESAVFYNNILEKGESANRNLKLSLPNYGMYYLNYYVSDGKKEYRECYPFAMLPEHEFEHRAESPFGICAPHVETYDEGTSTLDILNKLGVSLLRLGESYDKMDFKNRLKDYNITKYTDGAHCAFGEDRVEGFLKGLESSCKAWMDDCAYFLMAGETDSGVKGNYEGSKRILDKHLVPYTYEPAYKYLSEHYPDKLDKVIWHSNCHGTTEWLEAFYECGMWDKSNIIDIHSYSSPSGPDKIFSNTNESMRANTFSNEYAASRWKRITRRYGDKKVMISETGYPTPPANRDTTEIDIRTQADFNVRIALFFMEINALEITYYCLFDRTGRKVGTSDWNEMYFGALLNYDYYGVYQPKPWAPALSVLTQIFDGYKNCEFNPLDEEENGTLRAFDVEMMNGEKMSVMWSNVYMLPNTTAIGRVNRTKRIPMPSWENRWTQTETRSFDAAGDTVRVVDIMGNEKIYNAVDGKVDIEISGSPIYVYGLKY